MITHKTITIKIIGLLHMGVYLTIYFFMCKILGKILEFGSILGGNQQFHWLAPV